MSARMPETVQQAWGEPAVRDFTAWLEGVMAKGTVGRDEFGVLDRRLTVVEHDVADIKVEQRELRREMNLRFDRVNERFDAVNGRFDRMSTEVNERFDAVNDRFDRMSTEVNERFDRMRTEVGERFDRTSRQLDQRFDGVNERFDGVNERFDRMHTEMDARFDQLGERMAAQMRWSVSILAVVATLVTVLVALGQMTR